MVDIAESPPQPQVVIFSGPNEKIYDNFHQFICILINSFHNVETKWTLGLSNTHFSENINFSLSVHYNLSYSFKIIQVLRMCC